MNQSEVKLEPGWRKALAEEFGKPYVKELRQFLQLELAAKKTILPRAKEFFAAFDLTPLDQVKVNAVRLAAHLFEFLEFPIFA